MTNRRLTVLSRWRKKRFTEIWVPEIKLQGLWLTQCGFEQGQKVDVSYPALGEIRIKAIAND